MTNKEKWPEGATHKIGDSYKKWDGMDEYSFNGKVWDRDDHSWSLNKYLRLGNKIIERPTEPAQYVPEVGEWHRLSNSVFDVFYVGIDSVGWHMLEFKSGSIERYANPDLRPIKSERDVFIERSLSLIGRAAKESMGENLVEVFGIQYDDGARFGDE